MNPGKKREGYTKNILGKKEVKADEAPIPYHLWNDVIAETYTETSKEDLFWVLDIFRQFVSYGGGK